MSRHLTNSSFQSEEIRNNLFTYSEQFLKRTNESSISFHIDTKRTFDAFCLLYTFFQYNNREYQSALSVIYSFFRYSDENYYGTSHLNLYMVIFYRCSSSSSLKFYL